MKFQAEVLLVDGVTGADPVADPEDVLENLVRGPASVQHNTDHPAVRWLFALDAPLAETATCNLWAIDDATFPESLDPDRVRPLADRRFYQFATAIVMTGTVLLEVTSPENAVPSGGRIYVQVTADDLTAPRRLLFTAEGS